MYYFRCLHVQKLTVHFIDVIPNQPGFILLRFRFRLDLDLILFLDGQTSDQ